MSFIVEPSRRYKPKHLRGTLVAYSFDCLTFASQSSSLSTCDLMVYLGPITAARCGRPCASGPVPPLSWCAP
jgi:hypothetical protein